MNAPVTRRALLGATAAVGAVGLPAVAFASAPPAPDADAALLDLIERHAEATTAWEAACRDLEAARDRAWAAYPSRPAALTETLHDIMHGLTSSGRTQRPDGRRWPFFNLDDLDRLRDAGPVTSLAWDDDGGPLPPTPNPAGEARRQEIVGTYDRWLADRKAVDDRLGLTAAEAAEGPLCAVMEEAEAAVEAHVPTTLAGMRAKAVWVMARCDRADAALAFLCQLAGELVPNDVGQAISAFGAAT